MDIHACGKLLAGSPLIYACDESYCPRWILVQSSPGKREKPDPSLLFGVVSLLPVVMKDDPAC